MTKKLQGLYKGNVGSLLGNVYLTPKGRKPSYKNKIIEVRPGKLHDDYSDLCKDKELTISFIETPDQRLLTITGLRKDEVRCKGQQTSIEEGFVYLVKSESYPGWIKAGMTIDYEERLGVYNLYTPTKNFQMFATKWVADRRICETILLEELSKIAEVTKGEWFKVDESAALAIFNS
jgi:hypothetical protein